MSTSLIMDRCEEVKTSEVLANSLHSVYQWMEYTI